MVATKALLLLAALLLWSSGSAVAAGPKIVKMATVGPEQFSLMKILKNKLREVETKANGEVAFKLYAGGTMGDEPEIVEKLKAGEIEAAVLTSAGSNLLFPEIAAMAAPFLVRTPDDVARVRDGLRDDLADLARSRGLELVAWTDVGFGMLFSRYPIRSPEDLKKQRMWAMDGTFVDEDYVRSLGASPVTASLLQVRGLLEAGKLDAVFNTPLGCAVLGWHEGVKYALNYPAGYLLVLVLARADHFSAMSPAVRELIFVTVRETEPLMNSGFAKDNASALIALRKRGVELVEPTPETAKYFEERMRSFFDRPDQPEGVREWLRKVEGVLGHGN